MNRPLSLLCLLTLVLPAAAGAQVIIDLVDVGPSYTLTTGVNGIYSTSDSVANMTTTGSAGYAVALDTSTFNMSGGFATYARAFSTSTFNMSGGSAIWAHSYDTSTFNMSGGFADIAEAYGDSTFNMTGGDISNGLYLYDNSTVNITASYFGDNAPGPGSYNLDALRALGTDNGQYIIIDLDILFPYSEIPSSIVLCADTSSGWTGTLNLIPEPATSAFGLGVLALGATGIRRWRLSRKVA